LRISHEISDCSYSKAENDLDSEVIRFICVVAFSLAAPLDKTKIEDAVDNKMIKTVLRLPMVDSILGLISNNATPLRRQAGREPFIDS